MSAILFIGKTKGDTAPFDAASHRGCSSWVIHFISRQPEISHCNMPVVCQQHIFWLEVTIYDVNAVQMLQCKHKLGDVKLNLWFAENLALLEMVEQFTSSAVIAYLQRQEWGDRGALEMDLAPSRYNAQN